MANEIEVEFRITGISCDDCRRGVITETQESAEQFLREHPGHRIWFTAVITDPQEYLTGMPMHLHWNGVTA